MYKYALFGFVGGLVAGFVAAKLVDKFVKDKEFEPEDAVESDVEDIDAEIGDYTEVDDIPSWHPDMAEAKEVSNPYNYAFKRSADEFVKGSYIDSAKTEHPEDDSEEEPDYVEEPEVNEEIKKYKKPRLIKEEEFGELAGIEKQTLKYWTYDDTLTTEENEELKDQEFYVGDCLTKYGFKDNDEEREIFVRNGRLGADYDIVKFDSSFAEWGNR